VQPQGINRAFQTTVFSWQKPVERRSVQVFVFRKEVETFNQ
jgi:hypothetical protein